MESLAKYIEYSALEIKDLKDSVSGVPIYQEQYSFAREIIRTYKTSYDLYLNFISYLHKNPSDDYTLVIFQIIYHEDITFLPLYINDTEILGAVTIWRLKTGK